MEVKKLNKTKALSEKNSKGVIIKMEDYIYDNDTINHLIKSEDDIDNGRTRNAKEVVKELREKYGF